MKRVAATLAGLAIVLLPSAIAMSSADTSATTAQPGMTPAYMQQLNSSPASGQRGRHCHHGDRTKKQQTTGEPDV